MAEDSQDAPPTERQRAATVLGWLAGGSLGLIVNYGISALFGPSYPLVPTTFGLVVAGCFGGMAVADRLGDRALRVLGVSAGLLLAVAIFVVTAVYMSSG